MELRKRKNLTKPKASPDESGRSTVGSVHLSGLTRPKAKGESGFHRLQRIIRDTQGCEICGSADPVSFTRGGKTHYRCPMHINSTIKDYDQSLKASMVKAKKRVYLSSQKGSKNEQKEG